MVSDALSDGSAFAAFFPRTGSILVKNPAIFSMWFLAIDACFDLLQEKSSFGEDKRNYETIFNCIGTNEMNVKADNSQVCLSSFQHINR